MSVSKAQRFLQEIASKMAEKRGGRQIPEGRVKLQDCYYF